MESQKKHRIYENLIYVIIWLVIIIVPVINSLAWEEFSWDRIIKTSPFILSLIIVFLINNYLLFPLFFRRKRYWYYLISVVALLALYSFLNPFTPEKIQKRSAKDKPRMELMSPPPPQNHDFRPPKPAGRHKPPFVPPVNHLAIALLVIGINIAIKLLFKTIKDENDLKELQKQHLSTELEYLRYQINPHFFMNTLNNIHSLIDVDSEKAKDAIISLSKIMRYVLYDSSEEMIPLEKEIAFLNKYIELMRMRFADNVGITVNTPSSIPPVKIPPLLFISFVENAFSHGISYRQNSFVHIDIKVAGNMLISSVENSVAKESSSIKEGGIGLENTRKRLQLLYGNKYSLEIKNDNSIYRVELKTPLENIL